MKKSFFIIITLLSSIVALSQTSNDNAAKRALQVGLFLQQERVYLHFDNSAYYLGETMWFKAYVSFGNNDRVSTPSKVLYVELVAPEGSVIETKKYKIDEEGCCNGEFELNPTLLSGYYEIRAYTRYMLNWGDDAIFSRVFPVFDKVNGNNWDFRNMLDRKRSFMHNGEWISAEQTDAELKFYPEGGNLVTGLTSNVAYELKGANGEYINNPITIYADKEILLTTTPQHQGKGVFHITPKEGVKYKAEVILKNDKDKDKSYNFPLPEVEPEGVAIKASMSNDSITFAIENNYNEDKELAFGILYRGLIGYYKKFSSNEKEKIFTLSPNELSEGVNKAIIFTGTTPLAERCFFVMHDSVQRSDQSTIKLIVKGNNKKPEDISLSPYEKITLDIAREDGEPIPADANFSLAINDAEGFVSTSWTYNIYTYLLLGSELKGYIPDAALYFDKSNKNRHQQLDLLMLTNGWTAYDWKQLTNPDIKITIPIERGITLKGSFYRKNISPFKFGKGREVSLIPQTDNLTRFDISYDNKTVTSNTFRTDSLGGFIIETKDFYGKRIAALIPQTVLKQNENLRYTFSLDRYFSPKFRLYDYWERNTGKPVKENAQDSFIQMKPYDFLLSSVEVVGKTKKEFRSRPPRSEKRFNFLDEWEYAQDRTFLYEILTYKIDKEESELLRELEMISGGQVELITSESDLIDSESDLIKMKIKSDVETIKYVGDIRLSNSTISEDISPMKDEYKYALTAADIVTSAMKRHNYGWAYWVHLMVALGEYDPNGTPIPDNEYLKGKGDAEKMLNFKEFVIRSDIETREQFENTINFWYGKGRKLDTFPVWLRKFYYGFLSQHYIKGTEGVDDFPSTFMNDVAVSGAFGVAYPYNPNYVACFIPYSEQEKETGLIPDIANSYGSVRYTSIQGYNESKKFYSPNYNGTKPTEKDFRRTLLWVPYLQTTTDGKLQVELYNTTNCKTINIDITGRDKNNLYSNDETITTRINNQPKSTITSTEKKQKSESDEDFINKKMDPEIEKACAKEHSIAMIYYNQRRYKKSIVIWAELAKYNYIPALRYIALCYKDGTGIKQNDEQSLIFFEKAARNGCAESQYELALLYKNGKGCTPDEELYHTWIRRAALQKEPRAMVAMAKFHLNNGGDENKRKAIELLKEAIKSNNASALYEYAKFAIDNPADITTDEKSDIINHMRNAASQGHSDAQLYMMNYEDSLQNYKEAYKWAKELSQAKHHEGTKRMGDYYYNGLGVKRDKKLAKDLYRTAISQGSKEAKDILEKL